jgi:3-dehydroquinate synthase
METLLRQLTVTYQHRVMFTRHAFAAHNGDLLTVLAGKVLVFMDDGLARNHSTIGDEVIAFFSQHHPRVELAEEPFVVEGGEACKNNWSLVEGLWALINNARMDRHSTILAIGGGAFLDLVGLAAATAHRGIRLVRMPTTTLSQGDGGVGVKNGVNRFAKKNWVGTFAVPWAVVNDFGLLETLLPREKRAGLIEGVKVSLLRDRAFFEALEARVKALASLDPVAVEFVVHRSAELHIDHIAQGGDPFELGSARPLDFGHWVAHKIEPSSDYRLSHGEAVAIGMAVDLVYARRAGLLAEADCERALRLITGIGFRLFDAELEQTAEDKCPMVLRGLEEFREHLGGELTITLVTGLGSSREVHAMDPVLVLDSIAELRDRSA